MADSERAASRALDAGLEVGLHINLTLPFSDSHISPGLRADQERSISYLSKHKLAQIVYNPFLVASFGAVFRAQLEEFIRLYGKPPTFYNGHHHMHLCANVILGELIPRGSRVRRTFSVRWGDKSFFNIGYRRLLDWAVDRRFVSTDYFFSLQPLRNKDRLRKIFEQGVHNNIEIETHPENAEEEKFLQGDEYHSLMQSVMTGTFKGLF